MTDNKTSSWRIPSLVGLVCALLGAAYVIFLFLESPHKEPAPVARAESRQKSVRIGTFSTAIDYAPFIVARSRGWLRDELKLPDDAIKVTTFQTLPSINEAFASGQLDVVFEAEVPAIVGRAAGIGIKITEVGATLTEGILVRADLPIENIAGLKGHSVAVLSGTAMHYGLLNLLKDSGVDPAAVKILNMVPPDAAAAFTTKQVDAWAVWPPWGEQQAISHTGRFLEGGAAHVQSIVAMRSGFLQEGPAAANAIVRAIQQAKVWLAANPEEGISLIAQELQLPRDVVKLAWSKHDWRAKLDSEVMSDIQAKATFLVDRKMIERAVSPADLFAPLPPAPEGNPP